MRWLAPCLCVAFVAAGMLGCQAMPNDATIAVSVPDGLPPTSRTRMVTPDVQDGREVFLELQRSAQRVGLCNPFELQVERGAHEVMSVSYSAKGGRGCVLVILETRGGEWLTAGFGQAEVTDDPYGFVQYSYSAPALAAVKQWYGQQVAERKPNR